ncbi:HAMP domain-containing sensor histidine kinase [uncultured Sphingomonas sp.]|uniref:sensor histidine kinase n=1 Tax=uncultured Sphingomonas sp. TaxID=158754 RepID=UPI0026355DEB|nr:HAMP domain-containing sensor histidine kinase [uncultured Sphingomonas sp.]
MPALRSLRSLTLAFLGALFLAISLTGIATYSAIHRSIAELVDKRIAGLSEDILSESPPGDARAILAHLAALSRDRDTADVGFALTDAQGRWLGGNLRLPWPLPQGSSTFTANDGIAGLTAGRALVRDAGHGLTLTLIAETDPIDKHGAARNRLYLFGFGSIVAIVVAGTILFVTLVSRRIGEVQETARAIINGDMQRRLPVDPSGGAFAEQATTFNRMLDRIAGLMAEISNVSNDIAHDMRTPLARLRSRLALIAQRPEAQGLSDEIAETIAQCDALLAMFAAALRIAEVEGGDRRAGFAMLDPGQLLAEFGEMMAPVAAESGHELVVGRHDAVLIEGDRQLLSQALINLVENALRHTPAGTRIALELTAKDDAAELSVRDNGPGIAPENRERALRRFGRLEPSRNRAGHGLGLPLADAVARLHQGALTLGDARPGLIVTIRLPRIRA